MAVARALIHRPVLLLADEPTGNLDRRTAESIGKLLLDLHRQEQTILIVVTHSMELADLFPRMLRDGGRQLATAPARPETGIRCRIGPVGALDAAMTLKRLRLRNLLYHWRGNLAVFLGVVVGTAVLTGALLVGDSLRGSLRERTLQRLGWVDEALIAPRFFRQELADELLGARPPNVLLRPCCCKRRWLCGRRREGRFAGKCAASAFSAWRSASGRRRRHRGPIPRRAPETAFASTARSRTSSKCPRATRFRCDCKSPVRSRAKRVLGRRDDQSANRRMDAAGRRGANAGRTGRSLQPASRIGSAAHCLRTARHLIQDKLGLKRRCNALAGRRCSSLADVRSHLRLDDWGLVSSSEDCGNLLRWK